MCVSREGIFPLVPRVVSRLVTVPLVVEMAASHVSPLHVLILLLLLLLLLLSHLIILQLQELDHLHPVLQFVGVDRLQLARISEVPLRVVGPFDLSQRQSDQEHLI